MHRVYLVEDSALLRMQIVRALEATGRFHVVGAATRATVAIREISELRPDIAVVDLQLEEGTGWEVAEQARNGHTRVVILTNHAADVFRVAAAERGLDEFFDKTTEFELFVQALLSRNVVGIS